MFSISVRNNALEKKKGNIVVETFSRSHEFISICICHSCSLVITHASGNEEDERDAAPNAAQERGGEKKKKKKKGKEVVFSGVS